MVACQRCPMPFGCQEGHCLKADREVDTRQTVVQITAVVDAIKSLIAEHQNAEAQLRVALHSLIMDR